MTEKQIETSPSKQGSKLSFSPRSLTRSLQERISSASPNKSLLNGLAEIGNPFLESPSRRGRSHVRNSSTQMMTRSRSRSMSRGTYLQWTRAPHTILANFFMYGVEESARQVQGRPVLFLTALTFLAMSLTLAYLGQFSQIISSASKVSAPFAALFWSGLKEAFGFGSFNFSLVQFAAASMVMLRSLGVKGFKKHNLQLNQSYSLWAAIACHIAAYTAGSLAGSYALYWIASKCRHNAFFITNARFRSWLNLAAKQFYLTASLPNFLLGLDAAGLVAGFAGFSQARFWRSVLVGRALVGIPARLASSSFWADASVFQMILMRVSSLVPALKAPIQVASESVQLVRQSIWFARAWEYAHLITLAYLTACVIKAVANTRAYNRFRSARR